MKITLVISALSAGGAERVLSNLANYWDEKGHDVTLITLAATEPFYSLSKTIKLDQLGQTSADRKNFLARLYMILKRLYFLRKAIQKSAPNVVISFVDVMNITTLMACFGLRIPVVVSERVDPNFHNISHLYQFLRKFFYPFAKNVIIQTQSAASYFTKLKNIVVIPNAVQKNKSLNRDFFLPVKSVISLGRLCKQKDFPTLIKAFTEVHKLYPNLTLTIYGEGEERANLQELIQALNMESYIFLPGIVFDIETILTQAEFFIFPSLYEGFPNALCEAMTAGLTVMASNCSGNIDVVKDGDNGRLFPVGDVYALVSLMKEILSDPLQCQKLSQNAKNLAKTYSPKKIYQLWDSVIEESVSLRNN